MTVTVFPPGHRGFAAVRGSTVTVTEFPRVWNRVEVELTTHEKGGLTSVDARLTERFDKIAAPEQS